MLMRLTRLLTALQFEKSGAIQTILYDRGDTTRYNTPCMAEFCGSTFEEMKVNPHCFKYAPPSLPPPLRPRCLHRPHQPCL